MEWNQDTTTENQFLEFFLSELTNYSILSFKVHFRNINRSYIADFEKKIIMQHITR